MSVQCKTYHFTCTISNLFPYIGNTIRLLLHLNYKQYMDIPHSHSPPFPSCNSGFYGSRIKLSAVIMIITITMVTHIIMEDNEIGARAENKQRQDVLVS